MMLLSELVFSLGFSQSVFPSKGFLPLFFFPGGCWAVILLNSFLCVAPAHRCVVCVCVSTNDFLVWRAQQAPYCPIVSTNDFLVWRAQQAPYCILVMVHVWHAGMLLHAVSIVRETAFSVSRCYCACVVGHLS